MKRPVFPGPFRRGLRRLGAAGLAAGTLWAVVVTAGSDSASAAWAALRAASPLAALTLRQASPEAKRVLFAALCRALGVPARLAPEDGAAEYW